MDIKEEYVLSDDVGSRNERELFVTMKRDSDDVATNTELKSETPFTKHLETVTFSSNWEIDMKTEIEEQTRVSGFGSQKEGEFLPEDPVMKDKKYNIDCEIEIKEEPWWLEGKTSAICDDINDGDFPAVKSSRLCTETISGDSSGKSSLSSLEISGREISNYNGNDHLVCEHQKGELPTAEKHVLSEQSRKCSDEGEMYIRHLKQKSVIHKGKSAHQCNTCNKSFAYPSYLKTHILIHEGKRPHRCKICAKSFTLLSTLKTHNLIHEGNKPHQCKTCGKSFTQLSTLKTHNLIHEGKKPHQCKTCDKNFSRLSTLKRHNLIHEGKKPYQCKTCEKSFTQLSNLKVHNFTHEDRKPYQCKACDKSFTQLSNLKAHNLIHEFKNQYQCETCDKSFTQV